MEHPLMLIAAILGLGAVYVVPLVVLEVYSRYRGPRDLICPGTRQAATVTMNAGHAAMTAAYGRPKVRITGCSRWPEHKSCDRGCLKQA